MQTSYTQTADDRKSKDEEPDNKDNKTEIEPSDNKNPKTDPESTNEDELNEKTSD